ncbi:MAG: tail fiber protein [Cyclobacteriaceae bacterium]
MKKQFCLMITLMMVISFVQAQWTTSGSKIYYNSGKVGIGTSSPSKRLHLEGSSVAEAILLKNTAVSGNRFSSIKLFDGNDDGWNLSYGGNWLSQSLRFEPVIAGTAQDEVFTILSNGKIGIGTSLPDATLTVKGDIHTQEVLVDLNGAVAPDYVFEEDYDLRTLEETEEYIKANKHLPEVPSAAEMAENGVYLKEMNMLLLKKVEELTLYLIEQEKRIVELEKLNEQSKETN